MQAGRTRTGRIIPGCAAGQGLAGEMELEPLRDHAILARAPEDGVSSFCADILSLAGPKADATHRSLSAISKLASFGFVPPCLPIKGESPPAGRGWVHEIKHDGFRIIAHKIGPRVRLYGHPVTT